MKELSIEEKAKRYDEAVKLINDYYQKIRYSSVRNALNYIEVLEKAFPELKESEDERIRKDLLGYLHTLPNHFSHNGSLVTEWIAWLKSLRHQNRWKPSDEQMEALKESCDKHWEPDGLDPLYTLWEQLKRLREE